MRLSDKDSRVLSYIQLNAEAPIASIARHLGYKEHTVRSSLKKFQDANMLSKRVFVDTYRLGLIRHSIFFRIVPSAGIGKEELIDVLKESEQVSLLLEIGGDFEFEINTTSRSLKEFRDFLYWMNQKFGNVFAEMTTALQIFHSTFGVSTCFSTQNTHDEMTYAVTDDVFEYDETDHEILKALMNPNNISRTGISKELGIPNTTLDYRIKSLEQKKIIQGYMYRLRDLSKRYFLLLFYTNGPDEAFCKKLNNYSRTRSEAFYFVSNIGNWDYEIGFAVDNDEEITKISREMQSKFSDKITKIKILPLFKAVKVSDYPFKEYESSSR